MRSFSGLFENGRWVKVDGASGVRGGACGVPAHP